MSKLGKTKKPSPWDVAPFNKMRFELKGARPITPKDIADIRGYVKSTVGSDVKKWATHLYQGAQKTMCSQCEKGTLSLAELCCNLILLQEVISDYVNMGPDEFLGWIKKVSWQWHKNFDRIDEALHAIYGLLGAKTKLAAAGWEHQIVVAIMAKTANLAEKASSKTLRAMSKLLKFFFEKTKKTEELFEAMLVVGLPREQVLVWVAFLRNAEVS